MTRRGRLGAVCALAIACLAAAGIAAAGVRPTGKAAPPASPASCLLGNHAGQIKHVIYLQFDNTHYNRDAPNVASDLEQMPHLLDFLKQNGTLFTNDHTILISHTAGGILSSLTGLYPDRQGQTVSNSYGFFRPDGSVGFSSSFKYWTDLVDATLDPLPNMVFPNEQTGAPQNTPAPWVPFTRAGCDVGGVGTANIELENTNTSPTGDMTKVFGAGSPEWLEAQSHPALAQTDFVGIAIHCSQASTSRCAGNPNAKPDLLPDEPGGYVGYQALYGAKYVDPAITGGNPCVNDTSGSPITDADGNCGFPGFDGMLAKNTLGYVAQMQENGVPVTYGYISDAHDYHVPNPTTDSYVSSATGPGEATHDAQLKAYDDAFASFFQNLAAHGIDRSNSLFVVTVDEGDHFAGGIGTPQPDGTLAYTHASCAPDSNGILNCPSNQIGEVNANLQPLVGRNDFSVHSDDAPAVYVNGNPSRDSTSVRSLEHALANLQLSDPYGGNNGAKVPIAVAFADPIGEKTLHMVNADPNRTPTFTMFGNPDFFFTASASGPSCGGNPCVSPGFAWNHGDIQPEIANTWVGIVGPGVAKNGIDSTTWTDHTNLRPTIMSLVGLHDDYVQDGRVLTEALTTQATPQALIAHREAVRQLSDVYEQLNASFGQFAMNALTASTHAIESTDESTYNSIENQLATLTSQRDALASQIKAQLNAAAFDGQALDEQVAKSEIAQANALIAASASLANS